MMNNPVGWFEIYVQDMDCSKKIGIEVKLEIERRDHGGLHGRDPPSPARNATSAVLPAYTEQMEIGGRVK